MKFKLLVTFLVALGVFAISGPASAWYYSDNPGYYRQYNYRYYNYYPHGYYVRSYHHCRWVNGHWRHGYWVPAGRYCW